MVRVWPASMVSGMLSPVTLTFCSAPSMVTVAVAVSKPVTSRSSVYDTGTVAGFAAPTAIRSSRYRSDAASAVGKLSCWTAWPLSLSVASEVTALPVAESVSPTSIVPSSTNFVLKVSFGVPGSIRPVTVAAPVSNSAWLSGRPKSTRHVPALALATENVTALAASVRVTSAASGAAPAGSVIVTPTPAVSAAAFEVKMSTRPLSWPLNGSVSLTSTDVWSFGSLTVVNVPAVAVRTWFSSIATVIVPSLKRACSKRYSVEPNTCPSIVQAPVVSVGPALRTPGRSLGGAVRSSSVSSKPTVAVVLTITSGSRRSTPGKAGSIQNTVPVTGFAGLAIAMLIERSTLAGLLLAAMFGSVCVPDV